LLRGGVPAAEVERLLALAVSRRTNLPSALAAHRPELLELIDRELGRAEVPSLEIVRPEANLVASLPDGLCERLGALPVRRDSRTGRIDVAVLDPMDPHVARELEFHLDAPVLRARFDVFDAALRSSQAAAPQLPSGPPLPLVRKAPRSAVDGGAREDDASGESPPPPPARDDDEPVLSLTRSKPRHAAPIPPPPVPPEPAPLLDSIAELAKAHNPDEVVTALVAGLGPAPALVLAVRGQAYEGRAGSASLDAQGVRRIRLPAGVPSVAETAVRQGYYLGTLPLTSAHGALREVLGRDADGEVYVTQVSVSNRPSLVVVVALVRALGGSMEATRRADELCRAAGQALEGIVVSKKRGGAA
jgi:hypothetical protein